MLLTDFDEYHSRSEWKVSRPEALSILLSKFKIYFNETVLFGFSEFQIESGRIRLLGVGIKLKKLFPPTLNDFPQISDL